MDTQLQKEGTLLKSPNIVIIRQSNMYCSYLQSFIVSVQ